MNCQREKNNLFRNFAFLFRFPRNPLFQALHFAVFFVFQLFLYTLNPLFYTLIDTNSRRFPIISQSLTPPRASNISLFALFCVRCFPCRSKRLKVIIPIVLFAYQKSLRRGLRPRRGYSFAYFSHRKANCLI